MRKIRVLVVDDSTVMRRLLSDSLSADPAIEIAGTAAHGKIAIAKMTQVNPDVVTLDMEMPEMDGLTTLIELRKRFPRLPIIMFSTLTQRGAEATLEALSNGATDYVTKPANVGSVTASLCNVRQELIPKIKGLCDWFRREEVRKPAINASQEIKLPPAVSRPPTISRIDMVGIGVSTGGPNALMQIIPKLPADFPVPVMIVQHMPPIFTKHLADRLNAASAIRVVEAQQDEPVLPGTAYLAPGDFHMTVRRKGIHLLIDLNQDHPENSCRPAVDVLFRSLADNFGPGLSANILTGMGQDGLRGCQVVRDRGGIIQAQDESTSVVWGMPAAIFNAGLANAVLPLSQFSQCLVDQCAPGRMRRSLQKTGT